MDKENKKKYTVIRDTREKPEYGWHFENDDVLDKTEIIKLDSGDYSLKGHEKIITVERKRNTAEIAQNILEPRFEKELIRLEEYEYPYIVCEFTYNDLMMFPVNSGIPKKFWYKVKVNKLLLQKVISRYIIVYKTKIIFAGQFGKECTENIFKSYIKHVVK